MEEMINCSHLEYIGTSKYNITNNPKEKSEQSNKQFIKVQTAKKKNVQFHQNANCNNELFFTYQVGKNARR